MIKKCFFFFIALIAVFSAVYLGSRIYYHFTDGFSISNIENTTNYDKKWEVRTPTPEEIELANKLFNQKFTYLGKGCQSYVFLSQDNLYVMKFIKHQRFRTKPWLDILSFIPFFSEYRTERLNAKKEKLARLLEGWQVAFNDLPEITGVHWVHLNENSGPSHPLIIIDKMGSEYPIDLKNFQFLIQDKVEMLEDYLSGLLARNDIAQTKLMMDRVIQMVLDIYLKGFADNDPALVQNTGVSNDIPFPVDVGQLTKDDSAKNSAVYKQALFDKTYRLREWLANRSPETKEYLEKRLLEVIGPEFLTMKPHKTV